MEKHSSTMIDPKTHSGYITLLFTLCAWWVGLVCKIKATVLIPALFNCQFQLGWSPAHVESQEPTSVSKSRHK